MTVALRTCRSRKIDGLRDMVAPVPPSPWIALAVSFDVQADGDHGEDAGDEDRPYNRRHNYPNDQC